MRRIGLAVAFALSLVAPFVAEAQTPRTVSRLGIIYIGGQHQVVVDGLRLGLREQGLEEGKNVVLDVREIHGDQYLKAAEEAAKDLERGKVDLIYSVTTHVTTAVKRATAQIPIVFYVGTDPVAAGLVESLAKPGGRLTGVHGRSRDLLAKRLEILKEMIPKLSRVATFINPDDSLSQESLRVSREAGRQLGVQIVERHVASTNQLRLALQRLKPREVQAYFHTPEAMVTSQAVLIIDAARANKLPTMFHEESLVAKGALVSYGLSFYEIGRLSAKHVQRILAGTRPKDLPVENYDKVRLALNLRTAREIALTISQSFLARADQVIQ